MAEPMPPHAIAIVGLAGRFPAARDLEEFWANIAAGREVLDTLSDAELDAAGVPEALRSNPAYVRKCTALDQADCFDAGFFGVSPREAQILDPQQRVFLECAWEALEHAGYGAGTGDRSVGVYGGVSMNTYLFNVLTRDPAVLAAAGGYQIMLGNDKDFLCTRVSYKLDLHGPSVTIQTACSTSLVAVVMACRALNRGECDLALAGGVSLNFPQRTGYLFEEGMILSPDGHCRPFDAAARGTRAGAGAGIVVLKRLDEALADRDTIHAVIRGAAINNDGAGKAGYTAPSIDGQVEVIATAQTLAGIEPRTISYIEAHGTGTPLGDPIEIAALTSAFRATTADVGFCRLGSLKANLGHLDAAAGVAGLIKTVLALKHHTMPPLANFQTANPQLDLATSPFVASAEATAWTSAGAPRRAGVSSFGIGGTNAHVVLEEAPTAAPATPPRDAELLILSAKTADALDRATTRLADALSASDAPPLADVAWTLQVGRRDFAHRRIVVARTASEAVARLRQPQRPPVFTAVHNGSPRPVAFLFSGQGSQHTGMAAGLYRTEAAHREAVDRCATLLQPHLGADIRELMFADNEAVTINETRFAQPALFTTEYALACLWKSWGVVPTSMLGHSIGEYVAAHLAGVLSLDDALAVVAARGRLMQALPTGAMAAVHLPAAELRRRLDPGIDIAAVNGPSLCTISGPGDRMADLLARLKREAIETVALKTSHAFHSAMMEPALAPFEAVFKGVALTPPAIPYVSNVTGTWITAEQATSPAYYAAQLRRAVEFEAGIRTLTADPAIALLEVGPGTVLATMARMTVGKDRAARVTSSLPHVSDKRPDTEAIREAAGRLWLCGVTVDWSAMYAGVTPRRVPLPTYPFERQRHWVEAAAPAIAATVPAAAPGRPAAPKPQTDAADWFWLPSWQRSLPLDALTARAAGPHGRWLVFRDGSAACDALVAELVQRGAAVTSVLTADEYRQFSPNQFAITPDRRADYERLIETISLSGESLAAVVHAWNVAGASDAASGNPGRRRLLAFDSPVHLTQALAAIDHAATLPVLFLSSDREVVIGVEAPCLERSLLLGPVFSAPLEIPFLRCRNIDLWSSEWGPQNAQRVAACLLAEAAAAETDPVVAYRGGHRWTATVEPIHMEAPDEATLPLRRRGTYLITGGTGGIGLTVARFLAESVQARLVLTARSALPDRSRWDDLLADAATAPALKERLRNILALESADSEVMVVAADVADESAMTAVVAATRERFGTIHGVLHAAGTLTAAAMRDKSPDDIAATLRPKVEGTLVLDKVLAGSDLDFLMLFSSISTAVGTWGMCDYMAANAFLDLFAKSATSRASRRVIALGWDGWTDVGFAAAAGSGTNEPWTRTAIRPDQGIEALRRVLAASLNHVYVTRRVLPDVIRDAATLARWMREDAGAAARSAEPALEPAPRAALERRPALATAYVAPASPEEEKLATVWSELLGN